MLLTSAAPGWSIKGRDDSDDTGSDDTGSDDTGSDDTEAVMTPASKGSDDTGEQRQ